MKLKNLYIILIIAITLLSSTSCGVKATIRKADKKFELGEYFKASGIYRNAYRRVPSKDRTLRGEVAFKMGESYRLINTPNRAEPAFANAVRYKYKDSIVFLRYAETLQRNEKYKEALANYRIYLQSYPDNVWAKNGVTSCTEIDNWRKKTTKHNVKKADVLNSKRQSEFSPVFSTQDGDVVYLTSSRENTNIGGKISPITGLRNNDFFVARQNARGEWESPTAVEGELNTSYDEGAPSFTSDGKTMYFTRCRTGANAEVFKATRAGAQWSGGEKVTILSDSTLMTAHPAISPEGDILYFVSDMPGGFGGKDIWRVYWLDDKWGALENLGPDINTQSDEMFPFVRSNGELYFASDAHPGFGGLDIFKAKEVGENRWTVENMMMPINSSANDFGITFAGEEERGFFSSNRKETKFLDKLWEFSVKKIEYILSGKITDTQSEPIPDAVIRLVGDDGTNTRIRPQKDGTYTYDLKQGVQYIMLASARGFLNRKETVTTVGLTDGKNFPVNFQLASVSKPVQVNNIFYEFGKWTLTPDSEAGLQDLAKLLTDNPNITMEIGAHTDMVGSQEANIELSKRRAQEVVNYLIKAGINPERVTAVGYGEDVPMVVTKELAKQYPFLKEGDILNEEYILTKSPQEQEIINQINRRTEFKVLRTTYNLY
jgi:peptidoglycan-associated lipoprotein